MKDPHAVTLDTTVTEADFSNKHLDASGAIILAVVLGCKNFQDKGGLASLTISTNQIGSEQIKQICAGKSIKCAL